jgi:tetratricopeptide (TPR) repeat protein
MSWLLELEAVVEAAAAGQAPDPDQLAAIARWRLGCGDGRGAARWHRWSLEAPPPATLRSELETLLLLLKLPQLAAKLGQQQGWAAVLLALDAGHPELALRHQQSAIAAAAPLEVSLCLRLASLWQQEQRPEPALELLQAIAVQAATPALCNAIAHLLEQQHQPQQAATWWDHSLSLDPRQPAALMQRSRNALAQGDAALGCHLAMVLLELDSRHAVAQELQVEALCALGAHASRRLALAPLVRQRRERYLQQARTLKAWWRPRRRRQAGWRQPPLQALGPPRPLPASALAGCSCIGLLSSRDGLELVDALSEAGGTGVVWNLSSPEPLVCHRNLQRLLPDGWQLRRWPRWQPELHGALDALVIADRRLSVPPLAPALVLRPSAVP